MRRALATLALTVTAVMFVLRFDPRAPTTFVAGTQPSASTSEPTVSSDAGPTTSPSSTTSSAVVSSSIPPGSTAPPVSSTTTTTATTTTTVPPSRVIDGDVIQTEWGAVQVEVTMSGSELTDVSALQFPDHTSLSLRINDFVLPIYREAALKAQSARFMGVSGATVTWWGYVNSMQSVLDSLGA